MSDTIHQVKLERCMFRFSQLIHLNNLNWHKHFDGLNKNNRLAGKSRRTTRSKSYAFTAMRYAENEVS
jgi:hypothetical protein